MQGQMGKHRIIRTTASSFFHPFGLFRPPCGRGSFVGEIQEAYRLHCAHGEMNASALSEWGFERSIMGKYRKVYNESTLANRMRHEPHDRDAWRSSENDSLGDYVDRRYRLVGKIHQKFGIARGEAVEQMQQYQEKKNGNNGEQT